MIEKTTRGRDGCGERPLATAMLHDKECISWVDQIITVHIAGPAAKNERPIHVVDRNGIGVDIDKGRHRHGQRRDSADVAGTLDGQLGKQRITRNAGRGEGRDPHDARFLCIAEQRIKAVWRRRGTPGHGDETRVVADR